MAAAGTATGIVANSATGSTHRSYAIRAEDWGQESRLAARAATTITNGLATLGPQTTSITSFARSGNVVTARYGGGITSGTQVEIEREPQILRLLMAGMLSPAWTVLIFPIRRATARLPELSASLSTGAATWLLGLPPTTRHGRRIQEHFATGFMKVQPVECSVFVLVGVSWPDGRSKPQDTYDYYGPTATPGTCLSPHGYRVIARLVRDKR